MCACGSAKRERPSPIELSAPRVQLVGSGCVSTTTELLRHCYQRAYRVRHVSVVILFFLAFWRLILLGGCLLFGACLPPHSFTFSLVYWGALLAYTGLYALSLPPCLSSVE